MDFHFALSSQLLVVVALEHGWRRVRGKHVLGGDFLLSYRRLYPSEHGTTSADRGQETVGRNTHHQVVMIGPGVRDGREEPRTGAGERG